MLQSNISDGRRQSEQEANVAVSVIIVSWNVATLLHDCLQAVLSPEVGGGLRIEVIVVDNASFDDSVVVAQNFEDVQVIASALNLGYGGANNLGMRQASGRYFFVLNPDTVPQPGSIKALVSFADDQSSAAIVAPRLLNPDGTVQTSAFRSPTLLMALLDLFPLPEWVPGRLRTCLLSSAVNGRYPNEPTSTAPFLIDHPLGAAMLLRRAAIETVGAFDDKLFMYSEEVELGIRLNKAGWECWQVPSARVVHLGGQSTRQMPDRMMVELWRSRLYVYGKHRGILPLLTLRALLTAAQLKDLLVSLLQSLFSIRDKAVTRVRRKRARALLRLALGLRR